MLRALFLLLLSSAATNTAAAQVPDSAVLASLQPGDVVVVEVWREKDLSGAFMVDPSGTVTLPLLGPRKVAGIPFEDVRDQLLMEYQRELRNPSISITPLRRIYVLGEVNQPGLYTLDPTVTLAGAVAMAGGANQQGDLRRIRVIRNGEVVIEGVPADAALASIDVLSGDQIFVDRRGWFDRNSTFIVSALLSITSIIITIAR
jgi:protein involved in polysaccharide export with SLBB domain